MIFSKRSWRARTALSSGRTFGPTKRAPKAALVLELVNTITYTEAILDAGGGGRVVPGQEALRASTNAAQRQNARSQSDGAALGVLPRCADEE